MRKRFFLRALAQALALGAALALAPGASCGKSEKKTGAKGAPEARSAAAGPALFLDDEPAGSIALAGDAKRPLADFLPERAPPADTWHLVEAKGIGKASFRVREPARKYDGGRVMVYRDARGRPTIGVFRPVKPDLPADVRRRLEQPAIHLAGIREVRVYTRPKAGK